MNETIRTEETRETRLVLASKAAGFLAALALLPLACGGETDVHALVVEEGTTAPTSEPAAPRVVAEEAPREEPESSAPGEDRAEQQAQRREPQAKSPWSADVLDTGVDLTSVQLAASKVPAPAPDPRAGHSEDDGHDHAATPPVGPQKTYQGGAPDEAELSGDGGFLSVDEESEIHDFGALTQGDKVQHRFSLVTSGSGDLVVNAIKTSCGCTVAKTQVVGANGAEDYQVGSPLAPGSRLEVEAVLDTKAKQGRVRSVLTVESSDPRGNLQLQLMANVTPFFEIAPRTLNFGSLKPDSVVEGELTITSPIAEKFMLSVRNELLSEEISVTLEPRSPDADGRSGEWTAKVVLGPNIPEGPRRNYQLMFTSDQPMANANPVPGATPQMQQCHAFAYAAVLGVISATPHYMSFGLLRDGQEVSRTVRIENSDTDYQLAEPTTSVKGFKGEFEYPDNVSFDVVAVEEGRIYDVTMTMRAPEGLTGTFRGMVVVEVGHPSKPSLELPFTGVVRPAPAAATQK